MPQIELPILVNLAQSYIAKNYAMALIDKNKTEELRAYIVKYLYDTGYSVCGYDGKALADRLFSEMVELGAEYVFMEVSSHALDQGRVAPL